MLSSKDSILPAEVEIFANNTSHPLTSDLLHIPFGEAMYQEHVEISYFDRVYRIIGTSASVLRVLQSLPTLSPLYVVNDWYLVYKNNSETASSYKVSVNYPYPYIRCEPITYFVAQLHTV